MDKRKRPVVVENCEIIYIQMISEYAYHIVVRASNIISHMLSPGQFVHVKCDGFTLRRPISICRYDGDLLTLVFEIRGDGTEWLAKQKAGDVLDILGPLGNGFEFANDCKGKSVALVGGGIGSPPMLGLLEAVSSVGASVSVILGFKDKDHVVLESEFKKLCNDVRIATDDGSLGVKGFATHALLGLLKEKKTDIIMVCGPKLMMKSVAAVAKENDVPCYVSLEERMGCGHGACMVCVCLTKVEESDSDKYSLVCIDGPVFNADEVVW